MYVAWLLNDILWPDHIQWQPPTDQTLYRTRPFTEFWVVSIEHLRRVWHADRGRLLLRTPGPVPLGLAYVLLVETNPFPNLSLFDRTMLFEYPSVLSWFCMIYIVQSHKDNQVNSSYITLPIMLIHARNYNDTKRSIWLYARKIPNYFTLIIYFVALFGVLFMDKQEAAFASYRMFYATGCAVAFGYSYFLCVNMKVYILGGTLVLALMLYCVIEMKVQLQSQHIKDIVALWHVKLESNSKS